MIRYITLRYVALLPAFFFVRLCYDGFGYVMLGYVILRYVVFLWYVMSCFGMNGMTCTHVLYVPRLCGFARVCDHNALCACVFVCTSRLCGPGPAAGMGQAV